MSPAVAVSEIRHEGFVPSAGGPPLAAPKVGMLVFLASEAAFFSTLIMAYVFFLRQTVQGTPNPSQVFHWPTVLAATVCLLSSSATVHLAEMALRRGARPAFLDWWGLTITLGGLFLAGTALEWRDLIETWGLSISTNLFGTTYFTLVGFHALHVTAGIVAMSILFQLALARRITSRNPTGVEVVAWYWHFVDGVWVVVFTVVYVIGRGV